MTQRKVGMTPTSTLFRSPPGERFRRRATGLTPPTRPQIWYDVVMTLLSQIAADTQELRQHGGHPERLYLTKDDAIRLQYELISEGGERAHKIICSGLRQAVSTIDGLTIVWQSPRFKVA